MPAPDNDLNAVFTLARGAIFAQNGLGLKAWLTHGQPCFAPVCSQRLHFGEVEIGGLYNDRHFCGN